MSFGKAHAVGLFSLFAMSAIGAPARAQDAAPEPTGQHTEGAGTREGDDDIRLQITAGLTGNYGNARNVAINLAGQFALRRAEHALLVEAGWVYGLATTRVDPAMMMNEFGDPAENTNNFTARLRYDYFFTDDDAVFLVARTRRDPFARLEPRVTGQVGYLRNLFREENHRLWGEVGYDFTYDRFGGPLQVGVDSMGMPIMSGDRSLHSLRLFVGYTNHITDALTYDTGLQALMRFDRPEHWRFEWTNQLRSKIQDWLQISIDATLRVDSLPPGQAQAWNEQTNQATQMTDLLVTLNLVGAFDLDGTPEEAEPEEAEPEEAEPEEAEPEEAEPEEAEPEEAEPEEDEPEEDEPEEAEPEEAEPEEDEPEEDEPEEAAPEEDEPEEAEADGIE